MEFIADLHVHSKYSRATAKNLDLENLHITAQLKGITVLATGDFTHPAWWSEIKEKLEPAEEGLFRLKPAIARDCDRVVPGICRRPVRFMLVTEISNIYKKNDRTRKNHNLVFMPDMPSAEQFNKRLEQIGNIHSDGRPILGLDARNLLEIVLSTSDRAYLIPAHIWTPWFSLLGSKSGFDTVEECFEDLSGHIFALETGLSSDPPMNWRISQLDRFTLVSNSDAHSPSKLGREANRFTTQLSYSAIREALETGDPRFFGGTIEFFPEEGKYHVDGHRKCGFRCLPPQTRSMRCVCPVCAKPLTVGVLYRVEELADRPDGIQPAGSAGFAHLIPLDDILAEIYQVGPQSKKVQQAFQRLLERFGSELDILYSVPIQDLEKSGTPLLSTAVERMRTNCVHFEPGYDGEYGKVSIFQENERRSLTGQCLMFASPVGNVHASRPSPADEPTARQPTAPEMKHRHDRQDSMKSKTCAEKNPVPQLNPEQQAVVDHAGGPIMVVAGPGTGKTRTITCRMAALLEKDPSIANRMLAVTFTNKAAEEMQTRLRHMLASQASLPLITTFHGLCWQLLQTTGGRKQGAIVDETGRRTVMSDAIELSAETGKPAVLNPDRLLDYIIKAKQSLLGPEDDMQDLVPHEHLSLVRRVYAAYQQLMELQALFDFEDLIFRTVQLLENGGSQAKAVLERFRYVFVDEFQDINYAQYRLIRVLAPGHADICVIGDPDQAIYGFRGSDVRYFHQFKQDYGPISPIHLNRNYRSAETILESSFQVIHKDPLHFNSDGLERVYSNIEGFTAICVLEAPSARAEAVAIGKHIEQMVGGTGFHAIDFGKIVDGGNDPEHSFGDFGVLFRTREQGRLIAEILGQAGIPCQLASRDAWLQKGPAARLLAAMRLIHKQGRYADLNLLGELTSPGIGKQTLQEFKNWGYGHQLSVDRVLAAALRVPIPGLSTASQTRLTAQVRLLNTIGQEIAHMTTADAVTHIANRTSLASSDDQDIEIIKKLCEAADAFETDQKGFLTRMALQQDTDLYHPAVEKVTLMSMHAAKGLEFKVVFVTGCEEDLIPYRRPGADRQAVDIDEERRLFYVAMTRARERLFFSWARKRTVFGKTGVRKISPFVTDIEERLKLGLAVGCRTPKPVHQQLTMF